MKTKVVNLFAGPGTGKSTTAAALFAELKYRGVNCELVTEGAKDAAWEGRGEAYWSCQPYISGEQIFRQNRLRNNCDLIITDSPLLLGIAYSTGSINERLALNNLLWSEYGKYDNLNIFLERGTERAYNPKGRNQTEEEARQKDSEIERLLDSNLIQYYTFPFSRDCPQLIIQTMMLKGWDESIPNLFN
jgi:hypothetical protein